MTAIGAILLLVAVLAWGGFLMQRFKGGRLEKAPFVKTGDAASKGDAVAGDKGAISAEGKVAYTELVKSPVTQTECLYYKLVVTAKWKSGEDNRTQPVTSDNVSAQFTIDDGSGPVAIDAAKGGDFDLKQTFSKKRGLGLKAIVSSGEMIAFGDHGFGVRPGMKIKGVKIPMSADYQVTEKCVLPTEKLFVCGKWDAEKSAISSPSWVSLMMSSKSRDELIGATAKTKARAKMVGMITTPAAILLLILGAAFGGGGTDAADTTPANADTVETASEKPAAKPAAKPDAKPADKPAATPAPTASTGGGSAPAPAASTEPAAGAPAAGGRGGGRRR